MSINSNSNNNNNNNKHSIVLIKTVTDFDRQCLSTISSGALLSFYAWKHTSGARMEFIVVKWKFKQSLYRLFQPTCGNNITNFQFLSRVPINMRSHPPYLPPHNYLYVWKSVYMEVWIVSACWRTCRQGCQPARLKIHNSLLRVFVLAWQFQST